MDWFYAQEGRQTGPVSEPEFERLIRDGAVTPETLVWHSGMAEWQPYGSTIGIPPLPQAPTPGVSPAGAPRFCSACGKSFPAGDLTFFGESAVCAWCRPGYEQRLGPGTASAAGRPFEYAGFWIRALAYIIDAAIIGIVRWAILLPLGIGFIIRPMNPDWSTLATVPLVSLAISACYFVFFWTRSGATPGKTILRLKVVTPQGGLITTGQAVGRYFGQILSGLILCIGFMMAGWDSEKRALHDRLADTRVIRLK
jgi:uncharacterized RDD family membrane protein YckC